MSSSISLKVGPTTATVTVGSGITDNQVGQALTRFANSLSIPVTGDAQTDLTAILNHFISVVKERSKAAEKATLNAANAATIQATVDSDNAL